MSAPANMRPLPAAAIFSISGMVEEGVAAEGEGRMQSSSKTAVSEHVENCFNLFLRRMLLNPFTWR